MPVDASPVVLPPLPAAVLAPVQAEPVGDTAQAESTPPAGEGAPSAPAESGEPTESWTMLALRAHAASAGLSGYSKLNKADLLAKLRAARPGTDES